MHNTQSNRKFNLSVFGPGILMASAAVGGSHLISSTQAGALYGWQLVLLVIVVNILKYPFIRFGMHYTLDSNKTLLEGYLEKGRFYLWVFFILNVFSTVICVAAVVILSAAIISFVLPISMPVLTWSVLLMSFAILLFGKYRLLDSLSKLMMVTISITTVVAVVIAYFKGNPAAVDYVAPSPWQLSELAFLVALMGWMPAPIEISAMSSMWVIAKKRTTKVSYQEGIFDFNVGYISTVVLAVIFLALGVLVQYGTSVPIQMGGGQYVSQLINMYSSTIGEWSKGLIAIIAFMCIFGTTLTIADGYARTNIESLRLLLNKKERKPVYINLALLLSFIGAGAMIFVFNNSLGSMLTFAMIGSFVLAPFFGLLNLLLVLKGPHRVKGWLLWLSIIGVIYLVLFSLFFIIYQFGWLPH